MCKFQFAANPADEFAANPAGQFAANPAGQLAAKSAGQFAANPAFSSLLTPLASLLLTSLVSCSVDMDMLHGHGQQHICTFGIDMQLRHGYVGWTLSCSADIHTARTWTRNLD
jgi:hypothetical protein